MSKLPAEADRSEGGGWSVVLGVSGRVEVDWGGPGRVGPGGGSQAAGRGPRLRTVSFLSLERDRESGL